MNSGPYIFGPHQNPTLCMNHFPLILILSGASLYEIGN
jgi:hypothetical protein